MNESTRNNNQAELFNLIQNIQSKLNIDNKDNVNSEIQTDLNENIIEDLNPNKTNESLPKDDNTNSNDVNNLNASSTQNSNIDFSSILNNFNIQGLLSGLTGNSTGNEKNDFNFGDIDPNMILKFQKLLSSFNKNDPKRNLIKSLKPFLRKSRQDKIGEYLVILSVVDAIGVFSGKGSD